ncbi:aspartyl-phosphate phosphatase Spo0E family protein [Thalassobacillus pellis]|uniref:aspartyl-phosphate phosphatase Spo0E family protein n=1 Tax=Thalassobacillus pellis TaxID=748008 RepID=UPI00195FD492|nr:aspartyl-phosphate phosphatase Spo0E family protein [Thalassobacillus pellis]MBM7551863.1 hypothetical protein [Thalassobacillus pellis]
MNEINDLKEKIEAMRLKMYRIYAKNPLDNELLEVSQALDDLLNQLEMLLKPKKE